MNYERKSRRRFFLLMRSRTPPISSEFPGGGGWAAQTPLGTPLQPSVSTGTQIWYVRTYNTRSYLSGSLRNHHAKNTYGKVEMVTQINRETNGDELSASRPCCYTRGVKIPRNQRTEGWICPMARLDVLEKSSLPSPRIEFRRLGHSTSTLVTTPKILSKTPESDHMADTGVMSV